MSRTSFTTKKAAKARRKRLAERRHEEAPIVRRQRRSILDLLFLPPFLICEELTDRLRDMLHVR